MLQTTPPRMIPTGYLPDGLIAGNGDLSLTWGGTPGRIRLYIGKSDFWKASELTKSGGGVSLFGVVEIMLPQLFCSPFQVEQQMDTARLVGHFTENGLDATLSVAVCATENTILLELDRSHPGLSVSVDLNPAEGNGSVQEKTVQGRQQSVLRAFSDESYCFETACAAVLTEVSRKRAAGRETVRWAITVATNHDTAAYRRHVFAAAEVIDDAAFDEKLAAHDAWWQKFWSASSLSLADKELENHWYASLYAVACCARNKKFPPGLWGTYCTTDSMEWGGDYHLNYNYYAPFYALCAVNHPELLDCYDAPLYDYLPLAKQYARDYLGCRGAYYPVSIGPLGMESDIHPEALEHGRLFCGQKSNAAYAAVVMLFRWYTTLDKAYACERVLPFLKEVAYFWEDYLAEVDGVYHVLNDALNEVGFCSEEYEPFSNDGRGDNDPALSLGLIRMVLRGLLDICAACGIDNADMPRWRHILANLVPIETAECNGVSILRPVVGASDLRRLPNELVYPVGAITRDDRELYEAAQNTHRLLALWYGHNTFCSYYPAAARLGVDPQTILTHIKATIQTRGLPSGMFLFGGGGMENCAAIPATISEMLAPSYDGVLRLFACWDLATDVSFRGFRTFGAFVVDADLQNGIFTATITSEKGRPLTLAVPGTGYMLCQGDNSIPLDGEVTVETAVGEVLTIRKA